MVERGWREVEKEKGEVGSVVVAVVRSWREEEREMELELGLVLPPSQLSVFSLLVGLLLALAPEHGAFWCEVEGLVVVERPLGGI